MAFLEPLVKPCLLRRVRSLLDLGFYIHYVDFKYLYAKGILNRGFYVGT